MAIKEIEKLNVKPIRQALGFNTDVFGVITETSSRTIERWEKRGSVPEDSAPGVFNRLGEIQEVIRLGRLVYGDENFKTFLRTPLPVFQGKTAMQLMMIGETPRVLVALATDYEGGGY